jgi:hypothetical protein
MTTGPVPRARKPAKAPSKADLDERDRYAKLTAGSVDTVRGSAQTWRTGLTAFITLVTTGVVIKGRDTTAGLTTGWRALLTILIGGGLLLAVVGLWQALAAEAGTDPKKQTLQDIRAAHGTLTTYEVHLAASAARRLQWGRRAVAGAVLFLLAGIAATWWAPAAAPSPPAHITVTHRHAITCGTLQSVGEEIRDNGLLRLRDAVALLESKTPTEEVDGYQRFVLTLADKVAAHALGMRAEREPCRGRGYPAALGTTGS